MISRFFIDRPIFASVLSIVITLAGAISVFTLPLAQFPNVSPPTVSVSCNYPGASARDVAGSVAAPIEQQVNGVEGMLYMSSSCANDGSYGLSVVFKHGINLNMAQVLVQNRVSLALPSLPEVIKQTGVMVRKRSPDAVMGVAITSPSGRYDQLYLSNFAVMRVRDELLRIEGVADLYMNGQRDYSIRIWVDPTRLAARSLTAGDVVRAIREQNAQVATGLIGNPPIQGDQKFEITLSTLGRLDNVEQFENIIIKAAADGRLVRVKDIGSVELGAKSQDVSVLFDGKNCVFMPIFQLPDANALDVYDRVMAKMRDISQNFPDGVEWEVNFDTTPYTRESINEVFKSLRDAVILVAVVVLVFLQNWRSALIPLVAVPVAIIGTFAAMAAFGFSLNNLTLFGLVLAIGIVVDDAIVVVEAVEHHIENGLAPREATILAMRQVSGPVIAVALVLSAVFVPCAFITGITGQFFRQFALTISVSTIISAFNSLTLSPALTALLLRPRDEHAAPPLPWMAFAIVGGWFGWEWLTPHWGPLAPQSLPQAAIPWTAATLGAIAGVLVSWPVNQILSWAFRAFNRGFDLAGGIYTWTVGKFLHVSLLVLVVYGGLLALTYRDFMHTPKGFIPSQDMGYLLINVQLPDSTSDERTAQVIRKIEKIAAGTPGIKHVTGITGQSFALNAYGSNFGSLFIGLDDYDKRRDPKLSSPSIVASLNESFTHLPDAMVQVFPPPPVRGVGRAGGFTMMVEDRSSVGLTALQEQTESLVRRGNDQGELTNLFTVFRANVPMLKVEPDARECMEKGVNLRDFADTLQVYQGSLYVNDFNLFGRTWQVIVQADQQFRDQIEDIPKLQVRNAEGTMVPVGSLANIRQINGPLVLTRYNMYPAAGITGAGKPGVSSRDAINIMEQLADADLPKSMAFEWTEMAYLELMAGNTAMVLFGFAVVMVFLVLAAQYESWSLPLAVILVVPMCLFSAIIGVNQAKMDINIFTQIGFVVLVGLASKNAILIVEFAKMKRDSGEPRRQATLEACRLRLRPIVMTSFAFILGVAPLMLAQGAGAEMRRALGTAVFSGMLGVTMFGLFLTPVFFSTIDWLGGTPLFASRLMRFVGQASIGALTLRPARKLVARLRTPRRKPLNPKLRRPQSPCCKSEGAVFSNFFINRPIFASVLSIVVTLAGGIALFTLPIAQYPEITPPTVEVSAIYPGANAQVVADTVAAPIEQQVNGVEDMLYMSSQCANDGTYVLTVTFKNGTDLNMAQVMVQNRVALAQPILPDLVKRRGVTVKKKATSVLMIVNLFSPGNTRDSLYLSNYATIQLKDELSRLPGVGDITYLGQRDYSMRLWLDPERMASRNLSTTDVVQAIEQQNTQVAAGQIGQPPVNTGQVFQFTISTMGRLTDPDEFAQMILKTDATGRLVRLRDVARIELGAQGYDQTCRLNGQPSVALSIYQLPGSNALDIAQRVRAKMDDLKSRFPEGVDYSIVYDTTPFINESINEVFKGLRDAVVLVAIVVLVFLQNWRSAIIPLIAVPVAIIGTFAVMAAMGFSLNNLTLFGLVLAIGIVVDDAIVVVEAVEHHIEHGLSPRDATIRAMEQVSGPVIAVGLVLSAVFIPCTFITGIVGQFFRQFALTIAVSMLISTFNSLTLSPALTALLLRPRDKKSAPPLPWLAFVVAGGWLGWEFLTPWILEGNRLPTVQPEYMPWVAAVLGALAGGIVSWPLNRILGLAFRAFNMGFDFTGMVYTWTVGKLLRVSLLVLVGYGGLLYLTYTSFNEAPKGFIPTQDKGYLLVNLQLPDSASVSRTEQVMRRIEDIARQTPGISHTVAISGQSILLNANAPNFGAMYVMLDDFHHRLDPKLSGDALGARLQARLQDEITDGLVNVLGAPPLEGLGTAGGFKVMIEDRGNTGLESLQAVADKIVADGATTPGLRNPFTSFRAKTPWLFLDIDRTAAKTMGISMADVFNTLQVYFGSLYVNDFNLFGRTWQVNVQADQHFRGQIDDLKQLKIRNNRGMMVPFGALATVRDVTGPVLIARYNMYPAAPINCSPATGVSSGQGIELMEGVVQNNLSWSMRYEWTELALLQLQTGNTAMLMLALAVVLVFLVLAAQYESWSLPLAVILVVPMCLLCSIAAVLEARLDINIFTQVGFVVLIGLACKNAILVVEFAKAQREAGKNRFDATIEAVSLRLRPIVMTSFAFILGVVPLVISVGAGAEMRRTLGTAVFGGMLGVTLFGIFLTPVFYYVIESFNDLWRRFKSRGSNRQDSTPKVPRGRRFFSRWLGGRNGATSTPQPVAGADSV